MVEEVSFGRLTPGSPYILVDEGFEGNPRAGVFDSYVKVRRHWKAVFNKVEYLEEDDHSWNNYRDGEQIDPRKTRFLRDLSNVIRATMKKGTDQMVREVYEAKTGQDAGPGTGAADLIRKFLRAKPPKHAMGGRTLKHVGRSRKTRRSRK
jgi:hypothetical protein